jgi:hypothetical protein
VSGNGVETVVVILEVREDGKDHPSDARLAAKYPFCPNAAVDTAVGLEPSVEKERAGLSRLRLLAGRPKSRSNTLLSFQLFFVGTPTPIVICLVSAIFWKSSNLCQEFF